MKYWTPLLLLLLIPGVAGAVAAPNLLLLSVDTLRADHLGCYGYPRATSPNIDSIATGALRFTRAHTPIPLTTPAFASLLTSRFPHSTGAIRNGLPLRGDSPVLQEELYQAGYRTAAILSNWPLKSRLSALDRGFELYDDAFIERRWFLFKTERDARRITELTLEWLEGAQEPFFLWVHFSEPHAPYELHREFSFPEDPRVDSPGAAGERNRRYDSEIRYADEQIGILWRHLREGGLLDRTIVAFLADHGESLGEHGYVGHGRRLYQPTCRIPLLLRVPGRPGRTDDRPISLLDLAPTLLSLMGMPPQARFEGRDLAASLWSDRSSPSTPLYLETYRGAVPRMPGAKKVMQSRNPLQISLLRWPHKLIYSYKTHRAELYDLREDPEELRSLTRAEPEVMTRMLTELTDWYRVSEKYKPPKKQDPLTDEDLQQLRALGYID